MLPADPNLIHRSAVGHHARIVAQGGGIFAGYMEYLVLFHSPATHSTLSLPENDLTVEAVSRTIAESNKQFGK